MTETERPAARLDRIVATRLGLVSFSVFVLFGCVVYMNTWNTEFFFDGVHLVQPYDADGLREAMVGNWDPNNWETPGYRPMSALFNHVRASLFGELVLAHRLFLVVLMALSLSLLTCAGVRLGVGHWAGIGGGVLLLAAPNNYYHITWVSDGVHVVPLLCGAVAILVATRPTRPWSWAVVHGAGMAALLAREEGVGMYGVAVVVALVRAPGPLWRRALVYALPSLLLVLGFLELRQSLVPDANETGFGTIPLARYVRFWKQSALHTINLMALRPGSGWVVWRIGLALVLAVGLIFSKRPQRIAIMLYLVFALVSVTPVMMSYRENLVLAPTLFVAMGLALCLESVARIVPRAAAVAMLLGAIALIVSMVRENKVYQEIYHPYCATALESQAWVLSDASVHLPEARRERLSRRLRSVGVADVPYEEMSAEVEKLAERARARRRPDGTEPFLPRRRQWIYRPSGLAADRRVP